jgi:hypothetical protein
VIGDRDDGHVNRFRDKSKSAPIEDSPISNPKKEAETFELRSSHAVHHRSRESIGSGTAFGPSNQSAIPFQAHPAALGSHWCHSTAHDCTRVLKLSIDAQEASSGNRTFKRRAAFNPSNTSTITLIASVPTTAGALEIVRAVRSFESVACAAIRYRFTETHPRTVHRTLSTRE